MTTLHLAKADEENLKFSDGPVEVDEYDDHALHIEEHTRFLLSGGTGGGGTVKKNAILHLRRHREELKKSTADLAAAV